ncbi:MAG: hypothetical protein R3190_00225 [Thermoanaerobaculia bacterium]|nr:hypothetical protein [Thermoanaerobaculia bacterium]
MHRLASSGVSLLLAAAMLVALAPAAVAGSEIVGHITSIGAQIDGIKVPSGTTLLSPALVSTGKQSAILHLAGGHVVNLGPETTAHVTALENGLVGLSIDEGSAAYLSAAGDLVTLGNLGTARFVPRAGAGAAAAAGQIEEGEEAEIRLCQLRNSNPAKFNICTITDPASGQCEWEPLDVTPANIGDHLNVDSVLAEGETWAGATGNDLGLDRDCGTDPAAAFLAGGAAVAGGLVGGAALFDAIDSDETISPVVPQ